MANDTNLTLTWLGTSTVDTTFTPRYLATYLATDSVCDAHTLGTQPERAKETNMRGLYEVFIVEPDAGNVLGPYRVIASDEAKAKLMAVAKHYDADKVDDADVLVRKIGDVRPKREVQQVKIVP